MSPPMMPGPLMTDVEGVELTTEDQELIRHPRVGGVILFTRNYQNRAQLRVLTTAIRAARPGPILIAADQEGGRVQRFREEFTAIPAMRLLGQKYDEDPAAACRTCANAALILAWELRQCGLDFTFAPVVDIDHGQSSVIGDRSLHARAEAVSELAGAIMSGFRQAGCISVLKHFPGHGSVSADTHTGFAVDPRSIEEITSTDLQPFSDLCTTAGAIMPAHVVYESVDDKPASLSAHWQQKILRQKLNFTGAIISDDLSMAAVSEIASPGETAAMALQAGSDLVLICNDRQAALSALQDHKLPIGDTDNVHRRLSLIASEVVAPDSDTLARIAQDLKMFA